MKQGCVCLQGLCMELEGCGRTLSELAMAVQEFGRRNPLLAQQLSEAINKLEEIQHHTSRLAEFRAAWLRKVCHTALRTH